MGAKYRKRIAASKAKTKFTTLRALVSGFSEGAITAAEMPRILDAIELGIGLDKRDRAIAEAMESAPDSIEDNPIYRLGFDAGYGVGFAEGKNQPA